MILKLYMYIGINKITIVKIKNNYHKKIKVGFFGSFWGRIGADRWKMNIYSRTVNSQGDWRIEPGTHRARHKVWPRRGLLCE